VPGVAAGGDTFHATDRPCYRVQGEERA